MLKLHSLVLAAALCAPLAATAVQTAETLPAPGPDAAAPNGLKGEAQGWGRGMVVLAANVDITGPLSRGVGATSARRVSTGIYVVTFSRSVKGCFFSVTSVGGLAVSIGVGGEDPKNPDPRTRGVGFVDRLGKPMDSPFDMLVFCRQ